MRNASSLCRKILVASALAGAAFLISCKNDIETVKSISNLEGKPSVEMDKFRMVYSEEGKIRMEVSAPVLMRYTNSKKPFSEFKNGINVTSYNERGEKVAHIKSKYAIYHEDEQLWEARNDVVGTNDKGETLYTEKLFWNEKTRRISSDVFVKVVKPDGSVNSGEGIDSDEKFQDYRIKKPKFTGFTF